MTLGPSWSNLALGPPISYRTFFYVDLFSVSVIFSSIDCHCVIVAKHNMPVLLVADESF